jgi:hypothetical protein
MDDDTAPPSDGGQPKEAAQPLQPPEGDAAASAKAPTGAYGVWPADKNGKEIGYALGAKPDPNAPEAVEIFFGVLPGMTPPQAQNDLQASIGQVLLVAKKLYLPEGGSPRPTFRLIYTRLFRIAQLGLEGDAAPDIAKAALERLIDDLIDAEGGRVKNEHLAKLGVRAAILGAIFLLAYLVLSALATSPLLPALAIDPLTARAFMALWIGCFGGVWLSYAIRTTTFTLKDLVTPDADRLLPLTRLLFAGLLTMALGLVLTLGLADLKIGRISLAGFAANPTQGLLFGLFCGISELLLPSMVVKRASDLLAKLG